jgi:hypothetical protein
MEPFDSKNPNAEFPIPLSKLKAGELSHNLWSKWMFSKRKAISAISQLIVKQKANPVMGRIAKEDGESGTHIGTSNQPENLIQKQTR